MTTALAIIGDFDPNNQSHAATNEAIRHSSSALGLSIHPDWIGTEEIAEPDKLIQLQQYEGLWIAPASPYKNMDGALLAIRVAREHQIPLLGTCGGFQHIILEYARNVLGFEDAQHEETSPTATILLITRLTCSLAGRTLSITLQPNSLVARLYGHTTTQEQYYCNFGVNPDFVDKLRSGPLRIVGSDNEGVVRAVELPDHPFFVGTLFLPQHASTPTAPHPLISGFLKICASNKVAHGFSL